MAIRPAYRTTYETDFIARSTLQEGKKVDYSGGGILGGTLLCKQKCCYNKLDKLQKKSY